MSVPSCPYCIQRNGQQAVLTASLVDPFAVPTADAVTNSPGDNSAGRVCNYCVVFRLGERLHDLSHDPRYDGLVISARQCLKYHVDPFLLWPVISLAENYDHDSLVLYETLFDKAADDARKAQLPNSFWNELGKGFPPAIVVGVLCMIPGAIWAEMTKSLLAPPLVREVELTQRLIERLF